MRPFRRSDRDQVTALVNAHVQAVVPGIVVSVNAVLSQLEREPGEFVVDPWVVGRSTLVAEQRGRIVAATHLLRYGAGPEVGDGYRGLGELRWFVCAASAPFWPDPEVAAEGLARAAVEQLRRTGATRIAAEGARPAPGVYGLPEQWPHVVAVLRHVGFEEPSHHEAVHLLDLSGLQTTPPPLVGLRTRRTVGASGTRFTADLDAATAGYLEVELRSTEQGPGRVGGWADVGTPWVEPQHRGRGIARWLLGEAAEWLRLGHVDRLLDYTDPADAAYTGFLDASGFRRLTTTSRGWGLV